MTHLRRWSLRDAVAGTLEGLGGLDRPAELLQAAVGRAVPQDSAAKDALSGTWLGHPLHPALTDVVVGTWLGAWALDLLGGRDREAAADDLIAVGIVAAVPTALSGLSDWAELRGGTRRVGAVHALGNTLSLTLHAGSWCARKTGDRRLGARLSTLGVACAAFSAWLGGHLSFSRGVGVDQTVFEDLPRAWTPLVDEQSLESDVLVRRSAAGTDVLLVRHQGLIYALVDRCSHRGCSLSKGSLVDDTIVCSCHGSRFALDGALLAGPATAPQPSLETRVQEGKVEVRDRAAAEDSSEAAHA